MAEDLAEGIEGLAEVEGEELGAGTEIREGAGKSGAGFGEGGEVASVQSEGGGGCWGAEGEMVEFRAEFGEAGAGVGGNQKC